ncbi:MAG TPA: hypothetical protein VM490_13300 [Armatimonadaceae bacterium]|nr:hypothetical protein [Armatimonadaceae bacterium]
MSVPVQFGVAANNGSTMGNEQCAMEHLHLHMKRTHWETKLHDNLGAHLQDALDRLDKEGWEVVNTFVINATPELILRRWVRTDG